MKITENRGVTKFRTTAQNDNRRNNWFEQRLRRSLFGLEANYLSVMGVIAGEVPSIALVTQVEMVGEPTAPMLVAEPVILLPPTFNTAPAPAWIPKLGLAS